MHKGQFKTPIWIVFSIICLYAVILIAFNVIVPLLMRFYDPCWGKTESTLNRIIPSAFEFRDVYEINLSFGECISRVSFSDTPEEYCEKKDAKWYLMAEPNPLVKGTGEKIADAGTKLLLGGVLRRPRENICIPTNLSLTLTQDMSNLIMPGNYTFKVKKTAKDTYTIDYLYEAGPVAEAIELAKRKAVARYRLPKDAEILTENEDIKKCLGLLKENSDYYILVAVSDTGSNWYSLKPNYGNIYMVKFINDEEYGVYVEDMGNKEFEQLDCDASIAPQIDWPYHKYKDWERVTLNKMLHSENCDPTYYAWSTDIKFEWSFWWDELEDYTNVNDRCLERNIKG